MSAFGLPPSPLPVRTSFMYGPWACSFSRTHPSPPFTIYHATISSINLASLHHFWKPSLCRHHMWMPPAMAASFLCAHCPLNEVPSIFAGHQKGVTSCLKIFVQAIPQLLCLSRYLRWDVGSNFHTFPAQMPPAHEGFRFRWDFHDQAVKIRMLRHRVNDALLYRTYFNRDELWIKLCNLLRARRAPCW